MATKAQAVESGAERVSSPFYAGGFQLEHREDWDRLAMMAATNGETVGAGRHSYRRWRLDSGLELWAHIHGAGSVVGLSIHFDGQARFPVRLVRLLPRSQPFEIACGAWATEAEPQESQAGGNDLGDFPFVFDTPDGATYRNLRLPQRTEVQLSAFAFDVMSYPTQEAFAKAQRNHETPLAAHAFLPSSAVGTGNATPPASALIAGVVRHTEVLENRVADHSFIWARVETYGGSLDLIAAPSTVQGDIVTGGVLHGSVWLSGRILQGQYSKQGVLDRLIHGQDEKT